MKPVSIAAWTVFAIGAGLACLEIFAEGGLSRVMNDGPAPVKDSPGYWGKATANTFWCEADYAVTFYIAEFWNSMTSLLLCMWGLYGIYIHRRACNSKSGSKGPFLESRFWWGFAMFCIVGLGSFAFHATLRRVAQLADELPMVWGNSVFLYIVLTMKDKDRANYKLAAFLAILTVALTTIILLRPEFQDLFLLCYGVGVVILIVTNFKLLGQVKAQRKAAGTSMPPGSHLLEQSLLFYFLGLVLWCIERSACSSTQPLQLHAWWHVFSGLGTYNCVLFWVQMRWEVLGHGDPEVEGPLLLRRITVQGRSD